MQRAVRTQIYSVERHGNYYISLYNISLTHFQMSSTSLQYVIYVYELEM